MYRLTSSCANCEIGARGLRSKAID
ncbi:MAG: hypothetical protein QOI13_1242, partial [Paraburkholderia sp.]|nr:hypothetical protein [Paraburkholderia sp.]